MPHRMLDTRDVEGTDVYLDTAYGAVQLASYGKLIDSFIYCFAEDPVTGAAIKIRGNYVTLQRLVLYGHVEIINANYNSLYCDRLEMEVAWPGLIPGVYTRGSVIPQLQFFWSCQFWGGEVQNPDPLVPLPTISYQNGVRGLQMIGCFFHDNYTAVELGGVASDVQIADSQFSLVPSPHAGSNRRCITADNLQRSTISDNLFNGASGNERAIAIVSGEDVAIRDNKFYEYDIAIEIDDVDRLVIDGGEFTNTPIVITDSDRPQLKNLTGYLDDGAVGDAFIELAGTIDEAWIHGCALPESATGGTAIDHGVKIGASVSNTEVRTNSNNWRGASVSALNDSGTGTVT